MSSHPPSLTPLQELALEKIRFFEAELKKHGVRPRMSFEQEFILTAEDPENPPPAKGVLHCAFTEADTGKYPHHGPVLAALQAKFPHLHKFEREAAVNVSGGSGFNGAKRDPLFIYEAGFDTDKGPDGAQCTVADLAMMVWKFRQQALPVIQSAAQSDSTILRAEYKPDDLRISFNPVPYPHHHYYHDQTMGMHTGTSLYNAEGANLLLDDLYQEKMLHSAQEAQQDGALAYLQSPQAIKRIARNRATPASVSIGPSEFAKSEGHTLLARRNPHFDKSSTQKYASFYSEDRLPASDADPFIIAALELASQYYAVQHPLGDAKKRQSHPLPRTHEDATQQFAHAVRMPALLGEDLYQGILNEYGKKSATR